MWRIEFLLRVEELAVLGIYNFSSLMYFVWPSLYASYVYVML